MARAPFAKREGGPVKPAMWIPGTACQPSAIWVTHLAGISGTAFQAETLMAGLPPRTAQFGAFGPPCPSRRSSQNSKVTRTWLLLEVGYLFLPHNPFSFLFLFLFFLFFGDGDQTQAPLPLSYTLIPLFPLLKNGRSSKHMDIQIILVLEAKIFKCKHILSGFFLERFYLLVFTPTM